MALLVMSAHAQNCDSVLVPDIWTSNSPFCTVDTIVFADSSVTSQGNIISQNWSFGDNQTSVVQHPSHVYNLPGNYTVSLIVQTDSGCSDTTSINIEVNPKPKAAFATNTDFCLSLPSVFFDLSTIQLGSISQWHWDFGDGRTFDLPMGYNFYSSPGLYDASLQVTSDKGCSDSSHLTINVRALPNISFSYEDTCLNQETVFNNTSSISHGNISTWGWHFGDGSQSVDKNPTHMYSNGSGYIVSLSAISDQGCKDSIAKSLIIPSTFPTADFSFDSNRVTLNQNTEFLNRSTNASFFTWILQPDSITYTTTDLNLEFKDTGLYNLNLIAIDENGCKDEKSNAFSPKSSSRGVPNAFSPNGDGENDVLFVQGGPFKEIDFVVYDRWGQQIFNAQNQGAGWDGKFNGREMPTGVYTYILKTLDFSDNERLNSGDINLLR
ncbi:MAG: PKD domain-containing protein [Flavobacteriales bacterium]|nr:PKD domain-containing protein [Flavobacteriales bacterium]